MTSAFSWQISISLCPASFCTPSPNLPVTPGVSFFPFFKYKFIYFNWRLITLQYCIGFCHTSTWICHRYTCVPHPEPLLPPPSPYHPSGSSQCTSPKHPVIMHRTWTGDSFHIRYYTSFQCHSPKSSHPLPLPQSPKDRSIHLWLFCCLAYRLSLPSF